MPWHIGPPLWSHLLPRLPCALSSRRTLSARGLRGILFPSLRLVRYLRWSAGRRLPQLPPQSALGPPAGKAGPLGRLQLALPGRLCAKRRPRCACGHGASFHCGPTRQTAALSGALGFPVKRQNQACPNAAPISISIITNLGGLVNIFLLCWLVFLFPFQPSRQDQRVQGLVPAHALAAAVELLQLLRGQSPKTTDANHLSV